MFKCRRKKTLRIDWIRSEPSTKTEGLTVKNTQRTCEQNKLDTFEHEFQTYKVAIFLNELTGLDWNTKSIFSMDIKCCKIEGDGWWRVRKDKSLGEQREERGSRSRAWIKREVLTVWLAKRKVAFALRTGPTTLRTLPDTCCFLRPKRACWKGERDENRLNWVTFMGADTRWASRDYCTKF